MLMTENWHLHASLGTMNQEKNQEKEGYTPGVCTVQTVSALHLIPLRPRRGTSIYCDNTPLYGLLSICLISILLVKCGTPVGVSLSED